MFIFIYFSVMLLRQGLRGPTAEKTRQTIVYCAIDQYTAVPPSFTLFLFQKTLNNPDMLTTKRIVTKLWHLHSSDELNS